MQAAVQGTRGFGMRRLIRLASVAALLAMQGLVPSTAAAHTTATVTQNCSLDNGIQHVISITFDNTHLFRDRAGVPSDLEQMPNLLNFMTGNGTLTDNNHITLAGAMTRVFGKQSAQWTEPRDHAALAQTDFVGIAIHWAQGGGTCNTSRPAKADVLPDAPGGYNGFSGLFGAKHVNP